MLALTNQQGPGNEEGGLIYALGTPCGRFGGVKLARVAKDDLLHLGAWEYFSGDHRWTGTRGRQPKSSLLRWVKGRSSGIRGFSAGCTPT